MNDIKIKNLLDTDKTIAKKIFDDKEFPWNALPDIKNFILELGKSLPEDEYTHPSEDVWISKTAKVFPTAYIGGPCIIDHDAEIRHCAFIRGSAIVGKKAVVGNSTEVKNAILFDEALAPHYNYVGDSILGYKSHVGAGTIISNLKSDKKNIKIKDEDECIETGMRKIGAILGDNVEIGCNTVLCPGTIVGRESIVYPSSMVRGVVGENKIYKDKDNIVDRENRE